MTNRKLITATRKETTFNLILKEGKIPDDWYGHVFINSPAGTVNSNGLPYPDNSPEQGSPIMNGDGYVFRFDLLDNQISVQTSLMKPPCYYADLATKINNSNGYGRLEGFHNLGLTRMSALLGARNELNTAITPVKFAGDATPRMIACYDASRPYEISAKDLKMKTVIGMNSEYAFSTPDSLFVFPVIQTSAHPSFDPHTQELFIPNYTREMMKTSEFELMGNIIKHDVKKIEAFLINHLFNHKDTNENHTELLNKIGHLETIHNQEHESAALSWIKNLLHHHIGYTKDTTLSPDEFSNENNVYLLRHTG